MVARACRQLRKSGNAFTATSGGAESRSNYNANQIVSKMVLPQAATRVVFEGRDCYRKKACVLASGVMILTRSTAPVTLS